MSDGLVSRRERAQRHDLAATACRLRAALEVGLGVGLHEESQIQGNTSEVASQLGSGSELYQGE